MNDNIQIINKAGEGMSTEGIAYIEIPSTTKKYVFYTLNEKVDNDLTKIYIAEVNPEGSVENSISDTEWDDLRKKMIKISHKESVEDVNFLNMNNVKFNVGDPKKLAITAVAKQSFKDAQLSHTMATNQSATPVTVGSSPFFNQEVVGTQTDQVASAPMEQSIFANPPQPEVSTQIPVMPEAPTAIPAMESSPSTPEIPAVSMENQETTQVSQEPVATLPESIISPVGTTPQPEQLVSQPNSAANQPNVEPIAQATSVETLIPAIESLNPVEPVPVPKENVPVQPNITEAISTQPLNNAQQPLMPEPSILNVPAMPESPILDASAVNQVQEIPSKPLENAKVNDKAETSSSISRPIITDEEALKAISIIQEYINQESENNNQ